MQLECSPSSWYSLIGVLGLLIVLAVSCWAVDRRRCPARVRMAVAQCVLSIVMLDAVACYAVRGVFWAGMILLLLLPAMFLGPMDRIDVNDERLGISD